MKYNRPGGSISYILDELPVDSIQGQGATFTIELPFEIDHENIEQPDDISAEQPDLS